MKKAAAYARFSSENQTDDSIEAQLRAIIEYAEKNGYEIVEKYIDRARSAKSDDRPEFQRMIRDAKSKKFDAVIIHKIDRFARNIKDAAWYKAELNQYGVDLLSVSEDLTGASGDLIFNIMASVADWYLKNLKNEINTKVRITAEKAYFLGGIPPYGYDVEETYEEISFGERVKKIPRKQYVINEKEAEVVKLMFELAEKDYSTLKIEEYLNNHGFVTRKGGKWSYSTIYDILHNPKYKGTYVWARGNHRTSHIKRDDAVIVENAIPAIVSKELWDKVQEKMKKRNRVKKKKHKYLLKNLLYCGVCGEKMIAFGGRYPRYVCSSWKKKITNHEKHDHFISISREKVESFVIDFLLNDVFEKIEISDLIKKINSINSIKYKNNKTKINEIKNEISKLKKRKERLEESFMDAIEAGLNTEKIKNRIKDISNDIKLLQYSLKKHEEEVINILPLTAIWRF
ncbi:recombinase family protein [Marinitoga lauensis]|uniref:recombinase family protein n=1 Tax=Marinitoga lauensis TaxID=2201189 RepID=UPI0010100F6B|nr:recombinase family protein [Marinitoga lauensis]